MIAISNSSGKVGGINRSFVLQNKPCYFGDGETAQWLRACTLLAENLSSVPSTQVVIQLLVFQLQGDPTPLASEGTGTHMHIPAYRYTYTQLKHKKS